MTIPESPVRPPRTSLYLRVIFNWGLEGDLHTGWEVWLSHGLDQSVRPDTMKKCGACRLCRALLTAHTARTAHMNSLRCATRRRSFVLPKPVASSACHGSRKALVKVAMGTA